MARSGKCDVEVCGHFGAASSKPWRQRRAPRTLGRWQRRPDRPQTPTPPAPPWGGRWATGKNRRGWSRPASSHVHRCGAVVVVGAGVVGERRELGSGRAAAHRGRRDRRQGVLAPVWAALELPAWIGRGVEVL